MSREIPGPVATVWRILTHVAAWPEWGPTVSGATVPSGVLRADSRGTVRTVVGPALPFTVTRFEEQQVWAWSVVGIPATSHHIRPTPDGCVVTFTVPLWAPLYLPVCALALRRIERMVADDWNPPPATSP